MRPSSTSSLFAHVQTYFTEYLPRQRGASVHTIRAYRDALSLLLKFVAEQRRRGVASLQPGDLDADAVMRFLDHIETERSNSAATRNCRRAAIRGFFTNYTYACATERQTTADCLGLKRLARQYTPQRLEAACTRALAIRSPTFLQW